MCEQTKKDRFKQSFQGRKSLKKNYFFSGCIENLGVVPLFLSWFFLFLPPEALLFFLLFSVTAVLETIKSLLNPLPNQQGLTFYKHKLLPRSLDSVKALALGVCFLTATTQGAQTNESTILLSKGEHKELTIRNLVKFTNGNPEVLGFSNEQNSEQIILKGKSVGHSELILWSAAKERQVFQVYVLPKTRHLKLYQIIQSLQSLGLVAKLHGLKIKVSGELENLADYLLFHQIYQKEKRNMESATTLSPKLRKEIISEVYLRFFQEYTDQVRCTELGATISCEYQESETIQKKFIQALEDEYKIVFRSLKGAEALQNYRVRLKLVQFEQLDGKELTLGMSQLNMSLKDLFRTNFNQLLEQNRVILGQHKVQLSTLAEPETIIQSGKDSEIKIGSEIPYQTTSVQGTQTEWKFAGLSVKLSLKRFGNFLQVDYETSFTRPDQGQLVSGNKERSTVVIPLDQAVPLFQVTFQTSGNKDEKIPLLGDIPILGRLFRSTNTQKNYKNITGVVHLEKLVF